MNGRGILPAVVIAVLFAALPARAQQGQDPTQQSSNPLNNNYGSPFQMPLGPGLENPAPATPPRPMTTTLSPYILGASSHPDGCCGPNGGNGPISWDIYLRDGVAVSFGNPFAADLNIGWAIQGGARALLFDTPQDAAWVIDFGITNIYQNCGGQQTYALNNFVTKDATGAQVILPQAFMTGEDVNRTLVSLSLGRELWLVGTGQHAPDGCACGPNWRIGWDAGGRWGTEKFENNQFRHLTDTVGGVYVAAHTDLEFPCGACIFQTGVRIEYGYTWSDIIQHQNRADIQDILLMWNMGLRF